MITIIGADTNTLQIALLIVSACFLPMIVWMIVAGIRVKTKFAQYAQVQSEKGYTGAQAARAILDANGLSDVQIVRCAGSLTDHYDPTTRTVALSQATHDSTSIAAIGVAAHEVGRVLVNGHWAGHVQAVVLAEDGNVPLLGRHEAVRQSCYVLACFFSYGFGGFRTI